MPQIVPAILETTKAGFLDKLSRLVKLPGLQKIQVDFGDGKFVPNKILPITEIDALNPAFHWEAHLMLEAPKEFFDYRLCGFETLIVHYEAYASQEELKHALHSIRALGLKAGLAINPRTQLAVLRDFSALADQFLVMSVTPGFQGQQFIPSTLQRIQELRKLLPHAIIEVDGGINQENIKSLAQAGCDLIAVGSAITKADDMVATYDLLQREINTK